MTYTVTEDNNTINVRAIIASRDEMKQLVEALGRAEEKLPPSADKPVAFTTVLDENGNRLPPAQGIVT